MSYSTSMSEGQEELKPLPAEKLCNKFKPYNHPKKIAGDGPLGNEKKGKMHYIGNDKEEVVITLQKMLRTLKYDLGNSGPNNDGVDGKFWNSTEEAVIDFQGKHKDWDGEQLKEEGKVGPRTSDALNRAVVGKEYEMKVGEQYEKWYDYYQTPVNLTSECVLLTATAKALENQVPIEIDDEKKGKVVIVGQIPEPVRDATLTIRLVDNFGKPVGNAKYRLEVEDRHFEGHTTEADGILSHKISKNAKKGKLILDRIIYDLIIGDMSPVDTPEGALVRLGNLGYLIKPSVEEQNMENKDDGQKKEQLRLALMQLQKDYNLDANGELNEPTARKLKEIYGS